MAGQNFFFSTIVVFLTVFQVASAYAVCQNNGFLRWHWADGKHFRCECPFGFTGLLCEERIADPCESVNCNNGTCIADWDTRNHRCECAPGFTGVQCDAVDYCALAGEEACGFHGECINRESDFVCDCDTGFDGDRCATNVDDCHALACSNNGTCVDGVNDFTCECPIEFVGRYCEFANPCMSPVGNMCVNGICTPLKSGDYDCECFDGFTGLFCNFEELDMSKAVPQTDAEEPKTTETTSMLYSVALTALAIYTVVFHIVVGVCWFEKSKKNAWQIPVNADQRF